MRQINNIFDVQQVVKDLQDNIITQKKDDDAKIAAVNPGSFFISNETGATNAIAGGLPVALKIGLVVNVLLKHTLAAGALTFNASPIKSHRNPANNIGTGYAVGGIIELCWDGTNWQDLSQ